MKERLHVREGEHWRPKDLKAKGLLNFRGFKTLERWYEVLEEMGELLDVNDVAHAKALNALTMTMVEEVAAGGDWEVAWTLLPLPDPCAIDPIHSMSVQQYSTAINLLKDWAVISERRHAKGSTGAQGGGGAGTGGKGDKKWVQLSKSQLASYEKWKKENP